MIDVDVWPGPKPAFITADVLGRERQLIDARFSYAEDATLRIHPTVGLVHKAPIISNNWGSVWKTFMEFWFECKNQTSNLVSFEVR